MISRSQRLSGDKTQKERNHLLWKGEVSKGQEGGVPTSERIRYQNNVYQEHCPESRGSGRHKDTKILSAWQLLAKFRREDIT